MRFSSIAAELEYLASQPDLDSCPECGSPLVERNGEKVCHTCGTRQPIITQELAPGIRHEVMDYGYSHADNLMNMPRSAFLPLLLEGIGALGEAGAAGEGASAAAGMGTESGGANLGLGQMGTLMNNAMQGNQQENSPAVEPGAAGALGNPGQSMSIAPPGVVGRVAAGMFGDSEVGIATKNRGENSQPGAASQTGIEGSGEIGDSPEQLKDISGAGGRAGGDPNAADKIRDADGGLGDVATQAFHQNLPLVVEFAFSDQSGADHPILKALDEMLEQAYPGYKDGETFNETDTGESPTEKMEEVIGQDLDDDSKDEGHGSTAGPGAAAEVKPKLAPISHKTASGEWESLVAMVEELAQRDAKAGTEMMPMGTAPTSPNGGMVELPLDEVIQHLQSWPGLMGGPFSREFEALDPEEWEQLADYYRGAFDRVAHPDYGTGGGTFPEEWKGASQRQAVPAASVGMGYQTPGAGQVAPQQTAMMPGTGVPGAHGVEQCAVCGQAHMPGMCPLADNAGGTAGMDTGQAVTPPPPMPVVTKRASESTPTAGAAPEWDGSERRDGQQVCPFCNMELRDGMCSRCGRTSEDLAWTKTRQDGADQTHVAAPHDEDLERFAEGEDRDEHHDNRHEDGPTETGWYEDWKGPQEDDEDNPWTDDGGEPLEPGQEYEMHSSQYAIPDKITIEHVTPDKLTFLIHSGDVDYRDEVDKEDVANYGYTFKHPKSDQLDSESGFEEADAALPQGPPPSRSHNLKPMNLTDPRPHASRMVESPYYRTTRTSNDLASYLLQLGPGKHELEIGGTPFTIYYDEQGAMGDSGMAVRGDKTGEWEVFAGTGSDLKEVTRVHVAPHGDSGYGNSAAPQYAAEQVAQAIQQALKRGDGLRGDPESQMMGGQATPSSAIDPMPQNDDLSAPPTKQGHNIFTDPFGNEMEYTGSFRGDPVDSRDWLMADSSPVDVDPTLMEKFAGRDFSPREQREFIDEEGKGGPARNLHKLDLSGTHYEAEGDFGDSFF